MPDESARPQLPELARSLRGLGSSRGGDGAIEAVVFGPLLDARRAAEHALTAADARRAFDVPAISASVHGAVRSLAEARTTGRADRRRALEAELEEIVAPLLAALERLAQVPGDEWSAWVDRVQRVFSAADRVAAHLAARVREP